MASDTRPLCAYQLIEAVTPQHFALAGTLFQEYAGQLGVDLGFQNFAAELQQLPAMYGAPQGCVILALAEDAVMGCGALRRLDTSACEMKRLYVRRSVRGASLGRVIAQALIDKARRLGYHTMRLDTLADMTPARTLYASLGFRAIAAYYPNPLGNTIYLELALNDGLCDPSA